MNRDSRRLRLVLALLLLTSLTLLTIDLRGGRGGPFGAVRSALGGVFAPLGDGVHSLTAPVGRAFEAGAHSGRDGATIARQQQQIADLERQVAAAKLQASDRDALSQIGQFELRDKVVAIPASVTSRGSAIGLGEQTVTIDLGSLDHVVRGDVVVDGTWMIGSVVRVVDAKTSIVLLLTDRQSTIGIEGEAAGSGALWTASGQGVGQPLAFTYADVSTQLHKDDAVGTYPLMSTTTYQVQGAPVGRIARVDPSQGGVAQTGTITLGGNVNAKVVAVLESQQRDAPRVAVPTPSVAPSSPPAGTPPAGAPGAAASPGQPSSPPPASATAPGAGNP